VFWGVASPTPPLAGKACVLLPLAAAAARAAFVAAAAAAAAAVSAGVPVESERGGKPGEKPTGTAPPPVCAPCCWLLPLLAVLLPPPRLRIESKSGLRPGTNGVVLAAEPPF